MSDDHALPVAVNANHPVGEVVKGNFSELALTGSARDFRDVAGASIPERVKGLSNWYDTRMSEGLWPYSRTIVDAPRPTAKIADESGRETQGINFGSQDYLNLSSHEAVKETAMRAIRDHGVHSSGSAMLIGNTPYSLRLERTIADFLLCSDAILFPTGWAAGYGVIQGLVRSKDHVVLDMFAHSCLQEGAKAATRNVKLHAHLNLNHVRRILREIRAKDDENSILVVTEGLFSMHSDTPDLPAMQALCHEYGATLVVDVAHDLGSMGNGGRGQIEVQGMLGKIDVIMGSFSKTFASNGGFVATRSRDIRNYLKVFAAPALFSNALSPAQAATVLETFRIVASDEGAGLRAKLMGAVGHVRSSLTEAGFTPQGIPSAIVPVPIGDEALGRVIAGLMPTKGIIANLAEYPVVAKSDSRLRLQVMANHTAEHASALVAAMTASVAQAKATLNRSDDALDIPAVA